MHPMNENILQLQSQWRDRVGNFDFSHPLISRGYFPMRKASDDDCFAAGSLIRLANGSVKPVEELIPATPDDPNGDVLLACDGTKTHVVGLIGGSQLNNQPMLKISAESRCGPLQSINVCLGHSFVRGYDHGVRASLLRKGDRIQSSFSESTVTDVEYVPYDNSVVWDIYLASEQFVSNMVAAFKGRISEYFDWLYHAARCSLLGLQPKQHLIFANDFLVGDLTIQSHLNELSRIGVNLNDLG